MRTVCAVVLAFEAIVLGLAVPVAIQLGGHAPGFAGAVWARSRARRPGPCRAPALYLGVLRRMRTPGGVSAQRLCRTGTHLLGHCLRRAVDCRSSPGTAGRGSTAGRPRHGKRVSSTALGVVSRAHGGGAAEPIGVPTTGGRAPHRCGAPGPQHRTQPTTSQGESTVERTLVLIKPDGVRAQHHRRGHLPYRAQGPQDRRHGAAAPWTKRHAKAHYEEHVEKPFFSVAGGVHHRRPAGRHGGGGQPGDRGVPLPGGRHRPGPRRSRHHPRRLRSRRSRPTSSTGRTPPHSAEREIKLFFPDLA